MRRVHFLTHPEVVIDPTVPITDWRLSERGLERLRIGLAGPCFRRIGTIHCSTERKATDAAALIAEHLGLAYSRHDDLGENDRSSTGYLPRQDFERTADRFFAEPIKSVKGWSRAADEQRRIVTCTRRELTGGTVDHTTLIVSHGAVGALLMADLLQQPISRHLDQPGNGGGNWFAFDAIAWSLLEAWRSIDGDG